MTDDRTIRLIRKMIGLGPTLQRGLDSRIQLHEDDATMIQLRSLALLSAGPMTISELARLRQVSLQTASETVKNLEERAWLERYRNPDDRREWLLTVTHAGLQQVEAARNYAVSQLIPHLEDLTEEEMCAIEVAVDALNRVFSIPDVTQLNAPIEKKDAS